MVIHFVNCLPLSKVVIYKTFLNFYSYKDKKINEKWASEGSWHLKLEFL